MTFQLDHVIIAVHHLAQAVQNYRDLGFTVFYGGKHASGSTHNALICFRDGTYIELLAPTGEAPLPGVIDFGVLLTQQEGLVGYALLSHDLEVDAQAMRTREIDIGDIVPGERLRFDGVLVQWKLARIGESFSPFFIQDVTPRNLRVSDDPERTTHPNGAIGLYAIDIVVDLTPETLQKYGNILSVSPQKEDLAGFKTFPLKDCQLILSSYQANNAETLLDDAFALNDQMLNALNELSDDIQQMREEANTAKTEFEALIRQQFSDREAVYKQHNNQETPFALHIGVEKLDDYHLDNLQKTHGVRFIRQLDLSHLEDEEL